MGKSIKNNEYILINKDEFSSALDRATAQFKKFKGVVSVGFGQKHSGGKYKEDISIVVVVEEKKNLDDIPAKERIPKTFEGFVVDVVTPVRVHPGVCDNNNSYDTIQGGIQISPRFNEGVYKGTLGCIVRKKNDSDRENIHLLSNKHVLQAGGGTAGEYIYHPYPPTPEGYVSLGPSTSLGAIAATSFYQDVSYTPPGAAAASDFFIDCGTAIINIDSKCFGSTCTKDVIETSETIIDLQLNSVNTLSSVRSIIRDFSIIGQKVYKVGRTTGKTAGIVRRVDISGTMPSDFDDVTSPTIPTTNIIEIDFDTSVPGGLNCNGNARFGEHGDSGSLVVDDQNRAVGLLYGVPPDSVVGPASCTASHILPVLDNLGFCIPTTTGTSHCSCGATDGSGLTLPPGSGSGGGAIGIAGVITTPKSKTLATSGIFQPEPLTIKQQNHLKQLLETLRTTERGRELHGAFAHVRREIGYLVRNVRPVTVTWHRNKGPGFFALFLNHLRGDIADFPHKIGDHELSVLLNKMGTKLMEHGSTPLKETIEKYGEQMKFMLLNGHSATDFIHYLNNEVKA